MDSQPRRPQGTELIVSPVDYPCWPRKKPQMALHKKEQVFRKHSGKVKKKNDERDKGEEGKAKGMEGYLQKEEK